MAPVTDENARSGSMQDVFSPRERILVPKLHLGTPLSAKFHFGAVRPRALWSCADKCVPQWSFGTRGEFAGKVVLCRQAVMRFGTRHDPFLLVNPLPPR
jgi:hypothetical protein